MFLRCLVVSLLLIGLYRDAEAVETVRVDSRAGAPCLRVNGKPVRARCFWGAPGARPLPLDKTGRRIVFDFTASDDEPATATMHFRFGSTPGDAWLDDIRVRDLDAQQETLPTVDFEHGMDDFRRSWNVWPTEKQNTVGTVTVEPGSGRDGSNGLHVALRALPDGSWPDFHIYHRANLALRKGHRYQVSLWGRADPPRNLTIAFYRPAAPAFRPCPAAGSFAGPGQSACR